MGERRGMKALELWCKRVTDGYQGVKVENMTTSWRDGLAFCAIIHHFRPDLIDFGSLHKDDIHRNNELAFRTAEVHLGIPALLDAEDMVDCCVPDRLSILTYLSQFYQTFAGSRQSMSPSPNRTPPVGKRPASPSVLSPVSQATPTKMLALGPARREPCTKCGMPVFIAERLLVGGRKLFHRACFRCARCQHQLSLANCYETEDGQYCCEACPDEVDAKKAESLTTGLGDSLTTGLDNNGLEHSADFETVPEKALTEKADSVAEIKQNDQSSKAMSNFMIGQLQWEEEEVTTPLPPSVSSEQAIDNNVPTCTVDRDSFSHVKSTSVSLDVNDSDINKSLGNLEKDNSSYFSTDTNSLRADNADKVVEQVPLVESINIKFSDSEVEPITANDVREDCDYDQNKLITKCTKETDENPPSSIVKMRMRMFDTQQREESTPKIKYTSRTSLVLVSKSEENLDTNNTSEIDNNFNTMSESVNEMSNLERTVTPPISLVSDKAETFNLDEVIAVTSDGEQKHSIEEAPEREEMSKETVLDDYDDIKSQVPNFEETTKTSKEDALLNEASAANVDEIPVPATSLEDANKLDNAITVDLPVVPNDTPSAERDTVPNENSRKVSFGKDVPTIVYPTELNPFGDDAESEGEEAKQAATSTNPFGSDDDEKAEEAGSMPPKGKPPRPPQPVSRKSLEKSAEAARASLNPFWSDGEEPSSEEEATPRRAPVPRPRTVLNVASPEPSARLGNRTGKYGSANSLSSTDSSRNSTMRRKKKPAPPPPATDSPHPDVPPPLPKSAPPSLDPSSPLASATGSPATHPRHRKARPAPPPPATDGEQPRERKKIPVSPAIECEKFEKDEVNRNRQSLGSSSAEQTPFMIAANKSMYGQWKRKKGPAPARPVPQRREIRAMPMKEVKRELDDIDVQQLGLERQGVTLEKMIRTKFEETQPVDGGSPTVVTPDVEDLVLQLFEIVNEKNELFRRQAELMYLRRQHRLEEEHADLEYQIRCLLAHPDHAKTDTEKAYEEDLIRRLVDVVERRDEIVNCLEMDRRREVEEDRSIHQQLAMFAAKSKESDVDIEAASTVTHKKNTLKMLKKKVKKGKEKLIKKKEVCSVDADKDVDESEQTGKQGKDKKGKHKWF